MSSPPGPRSLARADRIKAIKAAAARQLAADGAPTLSLREVAREVGLVSSAIYRYFATRDELLTALIYDAYNDLGTSVERAEVAVERADIRGRWRAACHAVRGWALAHPHEYALLYGTPVPGYRAPAITVDAASRVARVMGRIVDDDAARRAPDTNDAGHADQFDDGRFLEVANLSAVMANVAPRRYVPALMAWTHVFGFVSFELFGHYVGSVTDPAVYFDHVVDELADLLDLSLDGD